MFGVEVSQSSVGFVTVGDYCPDVVDVPYVDGQLRFEVPVNEQPFKLVHGEDRQDSAQMAAQCQASNLSVNSDVFV